MSMAAGATIEKAVSALLLYGIDAAIEICNIGNLAVVLTNAICAALEL